MMGLNEATRSQLWLSLLALGVVLAAYWFSRNFRQPSVMPAAASASSK